MNQESVHAKQNPGYKNQKTNVRTLFERHKTQQYGIYTIEFSTPRTIHGKYVTQTDDIDLDFSKVLT